MHFKAFLGPVAELELFEITKKKLGICLTKQIMVKNMTSKMIFK